jgi:hypothetical protein
MRIMANTSQGARLASPGLSLVMAALIAPGGAAADAAAERAHPVTLHIGDRFEIPLTREAWDAGHVVLDGAFRSLVATTGEPVAVTLRAAGGRSAPAVWGGAAGFLAVPDLAGLLPAAADGGRLSLEVEAIEVPVFRVALVGPASDEARPDGDGRGQDQAAREIGGVRVRFDPGDAGVVGAFARGVHVPACSPMTATEAGRRDARGRSATP